MKILVVSQHYYPENFRITDICESLVKMGHRVTVLCGYPNYPEGTIYPDYRKNKKLHKNETINGVKLFRCHEIPRGHSKLKLFLNYYSVCLSMKRKAKKIGGEYDCVFINQTSPVMVGWAGIAFAKKHNIPSILYCYDLWPASLTAGGVKSSSFVYSHYLKVSKKIYNTVDHICVTSRSFIDYLGQVHGIKKEKMSYLPQYCEDLFSNVKDVRHEGLIFTFAGNVGKMQSVQTIIKAANLIKEREDIHIKIVGEGSDLDNCKELAKSLNVKNVEFLGKKPINEMNDLYAISDAMIVTLSKDELVSNTLPGKVQSYMAAKKAIIGSIDGETKNIVVSDANCGLLCEAEDYFKLSKIFSDFKKTDAIVYGRNALNYYRKNFSKEIFLERLLKCCNDHLINHS